MTTALPRCFPVARPLCVCAGLQPSGHMGRAFIRWRRSSETKKLERPDLRSVRLKASVARLRGLMSGAFASMAGIDSGIRGRQNGVRSFWRVLRQWNWRG
jgi:hypothetical protein